MNPFSKLEKAKADIAAKIKASEGRPLPKAFKASNASTPASGAGAGEPAQLLTGEDDSWPIGKIALGLAVLGTGLLVARKVLG
jgi:hypothetical protein